MTEAIRPAGERKHSPHRAVDIPSFEPTTPARRSGSPAAAQDCPTGSGAPLPHSPMAKYLNASANSISSLPGQPRRRASAAVS